ncbi:MAG: Multifunctional CCA protein [Betaproteobacteria bacterium ADurb.Bin341]|nr:MAG: Multifunctional CCA protein [Betaproteobacteria bacterium ADurb.Bin341]
MRDALLGLPVTDRDYIVVGTTPEEMLAKGFKPVGKDFPVFLHPETHEEYALARSERKTGPGYHGFTFHAAPDVTLEEDLARRDLTINALARDADGHLIDPYGGQADLAAKVLRHVSPAFAEDPVRILRTARFAARFAEFSVAPETLDLMRNMVAAGEADHLVAERVWQEFAKGLMEGAPSRMISVLRDCGALERLLPEVDQLFGVPQRADYHPEIDTGIHTLMALDQAARQGYVLPVRWAVLLHDLGKASTPSALLPRHHGHEERGINLVSKACARLKVPADCRDLALLAAKHHGTLHRAERSCNSALRPETMIGILEKTDAFRRPERFTQLLQAASCDYRGRLGKEDSPYDAGLVWQKVLAAAQSVDAGAIAQSTPEPSQIAARLRAARVVAVEQLLP